LPDATLIRPWPPKWLTPIPEEALARSYGDYVIEFAESYGLITKDSIAGKAGSPIDLRDWQKELIKHLFAYNNEGLRNRINLVGMPRKNGKSALGSILALYSLIVGPDGGEVYSVAAETEQARIVFQDAVRMIEASEELSAITKVYRNAIHVPHKNSIYRVLSAEAYSKEGLNPHFVMFDELHAQPNRELFDVMSLAMGARGNMASLMAITTAGTKMDSTGRDSIAYSLYNYGKKITTGEVEDDSFFMAWWEDEGDHHEEETWRKANPGFGELNSEEDFRSAVKRTPEAEFRTKRCNQWVSSAIAWLPQGAWDACAGEFHVKHDEEIVLGFDGSFSGDASVVVGATIPQTEEEPIRMFMVKAWEKSEEDDDDWRVDIRDVEETIIKFCQEHPNVREIACDPFRWQRSMQVLENMGLPIVEWPSTSPRRMVPACAKFYDAVVEKRIIHDGDPLLARHLDNAVTKVDALGPRIVKEKRDSPRKIDAAVAAVLAFDRASIGKIEEVVPEFFG
jgi:phage terminase large subunit-like protein